MNWDAANVAEHARRDGYKWVAVQGDGELAHTPASFPIECRARGLLCGLWEAQVDYGSTVQLLRQMQFDFWIGQIEGPGEYDRVVANMQQLQVNYPRLPKAIVTNAGGLTRDNARPLIAAGYACIAEGHLCEDGVDPRTRAQWIRDNLGWPSVQPMCGLGNGCALERYPGIQASAGWSVFPAEELWA